jgi:hypothetical protein
VKRFVILLVLASGCAAAPPKHAAPTTPRAVARRSVPQPDRPSILSGSARTATPAPLSKVTLEPCTFELRRGSGVRQTVARCYPFNGISSVSRDAMGTLIAMYSQSGTILVGSPADGPPSVEIIPVWAPLWTRRHDGVIDVVSAGGWKRKVNGAWTEPAPQLESGNLTLTAVWNGRAPVLLARTGGTEGVAISAFEFVGRWVGTPFWPAPEHPGPPPAKLHVEGNPAAFLLSYVPDRDGRGGLVVGLPHRPPMVAVPVVPANVRTWSLATQPGERLPLVALMTGDDITVAMPNAAGRYQTGTIPGDGDDAVARPPPDRDDREPIVRDGIASCSETVDSLRTTRLAAPAPIVTSRGDFLVFLRHRVDQRHRWTAIPSVHGTRCDWLTEHATEQKELVLAKLSPPADDGPLHAEELLSVPVAIGRSSAEAFVRAELVDGAIDVVLGLGMDVEHVVLDVP